MSRSCRPSWPTCGMLLDATLRSCDASARAVIAGFERMGKMAGQAVAEAGALTDDVLAVIRFTARKPRACGRRAVVVHKNLCSWRLARMARSASAWGGYFFSIIGSSM